MFELVDLKILYVNYLKQQRTQKFIQREYDDEANVDRMGFDDGFPLMGETAERTFQGSEMKNTTFYLKRLWLE